MATLSKDISGTVVGTPVTGSLMGGEYLGWTGFPGFKAQADIMSIGHLRWPGGINAEDRIEDDGRYAYDLTTSNVVDNWQTWNGAPRPGLSEMVDYTNDAGMSLAIIVPTARYVELAETDLDAALVWLTSDLQTFVHRLANGHFGDIQNLSLEIGAEYYSTNIWEDNLGSPHIRDLFAEVFAQAVKILADAEVLYGELYDIHVQMARFHNGDDPDFGVRNGEAADSLAFLDAYEDAGVLGDIDGVVWHRYSERFDQIDDAFRQPTHQTNEFSTLLDDHLALWETRAGTDLDLILSWSGADIDSSGAVDNPDFDHGPRSAHNILQMFSEVAASQADIATVYGIDSQWPGALSFGSPSSPDIYYSGLVYELILESVAGLSVTDLYHDNSVPVGPNNTFLEVDHVNFFGFEGDGRAVYFAVAGNLASDVLSVSMTLPVDSQFGYAQVTRLSPDGTDAFASGTLSEEAPVSFSAEAFEFEFFDDHEVVRIELFDSLDPAFFEAPVETHYTSGGQIVQTIGSNEEPSWTQFEAIAQQEGGCLNSPLVMETDDFLF